MARLAGRVALISGAGAGIGRAAAALFAREGANVIIADIDREGSAATQALVRAAGGAALCVHTDVTDAANVQAAVAATEQHFGKLDILFNCAGGSVSADAPLGKVDVAAVWARTMQLDLLGTIHCCHHALPAIVRAGGGAVVNMSSGAALRGASPAHIYSAAKGGILSLTRALAGTYAKDNVRVNAICAGRPHRAHPVALRHARSSQAGRGPERRRAREGLSVLGRRTEGHREYRAVPGMR